MHEKFTPIERTSDPVVDDASALLAASSLPGYVSLPEELLTLITSPEPEERLLAVDQLVSLHRKGNGEAGELLQDCSWDPNKAVRDAVERALEQVESEVPPGGSRIRELKGDLIRLGMIPHALRRDELLQELVKDAAFSTDEFQQAILGNEASLVHTLLRIERDTRVLYSASDLDNNFPPGWLDNHQDAIRSLILSIPEAQEVLLNILGTDLGGMFAAQSLGAVYVRDYNQGQPLNLDPLRDLLRSDDPRSQYQALTTIGHLGELVEILLPDIAQLLQPSEEESEEAFEGREFGLDEDSDEFGADAYSNTSGNESKESSIEIPQEERELRASVRGFIRSTTVEIMAELGLPNADMNDLDIRFAPRGEMGEAAGLALPSELVISDKFLPVLGKILGNEPLDDREFFQGLSALSTILHEGRHVAQFRVVPEESSAACRQEILRPGLRHLEPRIRSEILDGARASALDFASMFELDGRGEAVPLVPQNGYEEKEPLSIERLRAAYLIEVDAYCYETLKLWDYVDRFPSMKDAAQSYGEMEPPSDPEFYGEDPLTEQDRKEIFREILRIREGDEMPFSYFRKL